MSRIVEFNGQSNRRQALASCAGGIGSLALAGGLTEGDAAVGGRGVVDPWLRAIRIMLPGPAVSFSCT